MADEIKSEVFHYIPRNKIVQQSENNGRTVIEEDENNEMSEVYIELANKIMKSN